MRKKLLAFLLAAAIIVSQGAAFTKTFAEKQEDDTAQTSESSEETKQDSGGSEQDAIGDYISGASSDIRMTSVKATGGHAGSKLTISFAVSGNSNAKKKYLVDTVEQVYPVLDSSFPFETDDEAYKVINGTGNTLLCTYTFKVKDSVDSAYYPISFVTVYTKKNTGDGKKDYTDKEYAVVKSVNVKLTAKKTTQAPATTEVAAEDGDITMLVKNSPSGKYGSSCNISFKVRSQVSKILTVVPEVTDKFPFETSGDAYKTIRSRGTKELDCSYHFKVRSDVATGYEPVSFAITYIKNKKKLTTKCFVNVKLTGKKAKKQASQGEKKKTSTPRVMVTGYDTDVAKIYPNKKFKLVLHIKNNAKKSVQNVKFTLSTGNNEFLPVSGASTAYCDSIAAGAVVDIPIWMRSSPSLISKSYTIKVKSEYENSNADSFSAEDNVSIPVYVKDHIKITDLTVPDSVPMGGSEEVSFSINNMGVTPLNNVTVNYKGEGIKCEEAFVGNVAAGATGYASITLNGEKMSKEDASGDGTIEISYENASGESKTYEKKVNVLVSEEEQEGDETMEDMPEATKSHGTGMFAVILIPVIIVAVIVILKIRKKKRLKKEEELMDDDLL